MRSQTGVVLLVLW